VPAPPTRRTKKGWLVLAKVKVYVTPAYDNQIRSLKRRKKVRKKNFMLAKSNKNKTKQNKIK
jgi:hypothetical protein